MEDQQKIIILETLEVLLELQLKSVRQALGKSEWQGDTPRQRNKKRTSLIDLCVTILTDERRPAHVDELVALLAKRYRRVTDRDSLASALVKKAKRGVLFRRTSPATFEILE